MKLQFILATFIVILFMPCGESPREIYVSFMKSWLDIDSKKGIHQNEFFIYFGRFRHLVCISGIVCCALSQL